MATPKKTAAKTAPKPAAKAPPKVAPKAPVKAVPSSAAKPGGPAASKPSPTSAKSPTSPVPKGTVAPRGGILPPTKPGKAAKDDGEDAPVPVPMHKMEKIEGRDTLCQIEIVKDGHVFIARTETDAGSKEYKNTVFEDLLTEMLITLQEQMADH